MFLEVRLFQKLAKTKVNKCQPTKIEKRPLLYLIFVAKASNICHRGFYNALGIFSPKVKMLNQWEVFLII